MWTQGTADGQRERASNLSCGASLSTRPLTRLLRLPLLRVPPSHRLGWDRMAAAFVKLVCVDLGISATLLRGFSTNVRAIGF